MKTIVKNVRALLLFTLLLYGVIPAIAQSRQAAQNTQRKDFYQLLKEANLKFVIPAGFRETKAVNNEDFSFDFALEAPGRDFEMWLQVRSQAQNYISYEHTQHDAKTQLANPDSTYVNMGNATAKALSADETYLVRNIPAGVLSRYNADAGRSYLLSLADQAVTNHYKYALVISLQKNRTGTLLAVYFTNDKDPDFYKNINRISYCIKFKPQTPG